MAARSIDRTADARLPGAPSYAIYAQIQGSILIAPLSRSLSLQLKSHDMQTIGESESTPFYRRTELLTRRGNKAECYLILDDWTTNWQGFARINISAPRRTLSIDFSWRSSVIDTRHARDRNKSSHRVNTVHIVFTSSLYLIRVSRSSSI